VTVPVLLADVVQVPEAKVTIVVPETVPPPFWILIVATWVPVAGEGMLNETESIQ
jgi:hypothetical protein